MNSDDTANWYRANWSNPKPPFNATWQPDNVTFNDGNMTLTLDNVGCPQNCDGRPFASGEYRTAQEIFGYGTFAVRMRAARGDGLVSSFFVYAGQFGQLNHQEIDFEILGKNTRQVQLNYYVEGHGNHERLIDLGFDASQSFHTYAFRWSSSELVWLVDGREVHRVQEDSRTSEREIPYGQTKIMANLWPGAGVDPWLNPFTYPGHPIRAEYDWIHFTPLTASGGQTNVQPAPQPPPAVPTAVAPAARSNPLPISDIQQGNFGFNNGSVTPSGGTYQFLADHARDPGFGILTGNRDLAGRNVLRFEIRGNLTRHAGYARFIAQVYDDGDNDSTPSVALDPVVLTSDYQTVTVDLQGRVDRAKKVQFLLVTDNGTCQVDIRNIRFE